MSKSNALLSSSLTRLLFAVLLAQAARATQVCTNDDNGFEHCKDANRWAPSLIASCVSIPLAVLAIGLYLFTYIRKSRQAKKQHQRAPSWPQRQLSTGMDDSQIQGPKPVNDHTSVVRASLDMVQRSASPSATMITTPPASHVVSTPRTVHPGTTYEPSYEFASAVGRGGSFKKNTSAKEARDAALKAKYPFDGYSSSRPPPPSIGASEMV